MQELVDKVRTMLRAAHNNCAAVTKKIMSEKDPKLIVFLVQIGVEHLASKFRAHDRRDMRRNVVEPTFVKGKRRPSILTPNDKVKVAQAAKSLFEVWKIGGIGLGEATKDKLLMAANEERLAGTGHLKNAEFYEALAAPMDDTETVADHWENENAVVLIQEKIWKE